MSTAPHMPEPSLCRTAHATLQEHTKVLAPEPKQQSRDLVQDAVKDSARQGASVDRGPLRPRSHPGKPAATKKQKLPEQACPAKPPVTYVATNPKPASRQMIDSLAQYTAWLGVDNMCLCHDDHQGRYAVRSVKTERGTCVLKEQPLMHWLLPDVGNACAFCLKQLGMLQTPTCHPQHHAFDGYR